MTFFKYVTISKNKMVKYIANINTFNLNSILGQNIIYLMHKYELNVDDILTSNKNERKKHCYQKWLTDLNVQYFINAHIINELLMVKEDKLQIIFSNVDIGPSFVEYDLIINFLCIS